MRYFSRFHPLVTLVYFLTVIIFSMFVNHPVMGIIALLGGICFTSVMTSSAEKVSDLKFYIPLFFLISLTNPLFSHNGKTPLFFMNGNAVTLEAIIYGVGIAVMLVGVMMWAKAYSFVMTTDKFLYLFGSIVPQLSLVLSMVLRYVPMLKRQAKQVQKSQKGLGMYSSDSYFDRAKSGMRVMSAVVGWSLEHVVETSKSMKARGYGLKGRTNYSNFRFRKEDGLLLGIIVGLFAMIVVCMTTGALTFAYYPEITPIKTNPMALIAYICFAVLAILPFLIEIGELLRWNYYRSKI
ncbi:MAG: energy-coupling factor transporter transmembrane component T [Fastidiosipilaceae bacterium]|nr:energy-coupling factor transporter transmembrane protein EcfT [Clostridiaceae bacterium]